MPASFRGSYEALSVDLWAPLSMHEQVRPRGLPLERRGWGWLSGTGRLKPNVTLAQAQAEVDRVVASLQQDKIMAEDEGFELFRASALPEQFREGVTGILAFFLAVVSLVLLVACANIATVLLTRVVARTRETAIRLSMGATPHRLWRQWITESLLLSLMGGIAGVVAAFWMRDLLFALVPPDFSQFAPSVDLDTTVLLYTFGVAVLTGLLFGVVPAIRASRGDVVAGIKEGGVSASGSRTHSRLFGTFVAGQVAVSLVLLVSSGLLLRSLYASETFNPGFNPEGLAMGSIDLRRHGYTEDQGREIYRRLLESLRTLPGVQGATLGTVVPLGNDRESLGFRIPGYVNPDGSTAVSLAFNTVEANYFATMGIPLLRGHGFAEDVRPGGLPGVVVNETMANRYWPGADPVGKQIQVIGGPVGEVIGVVRDIKYYTLGEEPMPYVYVPFEQAYSSSAVLHVRAANPDSVLRALPTQLTAIAPGVAVSDRMTFSEMRRIPLFPQRAMALVSAAFGLVALALTAIGLYGVVSFAVTQRTREIGIRMALGAQQGEVLRLVLARGMLLALIGVVLGAVAAFGATRFLAGLLFGVATTDPVTYLGVATGLAAVTAIACYVPARRAMRTDPLQALRYE